MIQNIKDTVRLWQLGRKDRAAGVTTKRSRQWPRVERAHLKFEPCCAACGSRERVQVHHRLPFHLRPDLELAPANLITLCEPKGPGGHHLSIGHLGNWKRYNPNVEQDAQAMRMLKNRRPLAA